MCWAFSKRLGSNYKLFIIIMNIITFMATIYLAYDSVLNIIENDNDNSMSRSRLIYILFFLDYFGYIIEIILIITILFVKGKKIIQFLYEQDFNINKDREKKIGLKLVIWQILTTIILQSLFPICPLIFTGIHNYSIKNNIQQYLLYLVTENVEMSLISLMAYYCFCIEHRLAHVKKGFTSLLKFKHVSRQIVEIHCSIKEFNKFINILLFVIIMYSSLSCMSNSVIFYFDKGIKHNDSVPCIIEAIIIILIVCLISGRISKTYGSILDRFEHLEINSPLSHLDRIDYATVNRLYSLRDELCFTAFNLYKINTKTFMSVMSLIITFSVILIQTI